MNKPLSKNAVLGLIVAAGLMVFAAGWLLAVRPLAHKAATLRAEKASVYRQIAENVAQSAPATATSAPKIRVADVYKLSTAMPSIVDMPDLLLELQQTAEAAGVQLQSISPTSAPATGTSGYTTEKLTLAVAGDFYGVTDLLYRLRNLVYVRGGALHANGRLFSVQSVTLAPAGTAAKNLLNVGIDVDTYVYGSAAAATPAPAPGATTTTATTTTTTTTTPPASGPTAAGATP